MSFKRGKVVMLPTNEEKAKFPFYLTSNGNYSNDKLKLFEGFCNGNPQHLYILSNEEIKEGDWFLSNLNEILKCTKKEDKFIWYERLTVPKVSEIAQPFSIHINLKPKKIIATTDKSLNPKLYKDNEENAGFGGYYIWKNGVVGKPQYLSKENYNKFCLPQPSQSFIQKFVEEYNKGNVITEVMIEYETYFNHAPRGGSHEEPLWDIYLKINPKDNTITIRKIKDSWTREEVVKLINKISEEVDFESATQKTIDKWIEENL